MADEAERKQDLEQSLLNHQADSYLQPAAGSDVADEENCDDKIEEVAPYLAHGHGHGKAGVWQVTTALLSLQVAMGVCCELLCSLRDSGADTAAELRMRAPSPQAACIRGCSSNLHEHQDCTTIAIEHTQLGWGLWLFPSDYAKIGWLAHGILVTLALLTTYSGTLFSRLYAGMHLRL
jgi:hypothetical protein